MTRRWRSLYGRWYVRQALVLWVPLRALVTVALVIFLSEARLAVNAESLTGARVAPIVIVLLTAALWFDRTSRGLRVLLANLGFTAGELLLSTALVAAALETALAVFARR